MPSKRSTSEDARHGRTDDVPGANPRANPDANPDEEPEAHAEPPMKMTKEKVLLLAVAAVVAGVGAMDGKYDPVKVPQTSAPSDVPPLPAEPPAPVRSPADAGRSMFDPYNDLLPPALLELPEVPTPEIPIPVPPVRPFPHLDAPGGLRQYFFDPVGPPPSEEPAAPPDDGSAGAGAGTDGETETAPVAEPKKVDLAEYDWVRPTDYMGQTFYGRIELLPADLQAGRTRFDLLVDPALEFTFNQVDPKSGKLYGPAPYRARTEQLGFADNVVNNHGTRRARAEFAAGRKILDKEILRGLAAQLIEDSARPRYLKDRRRALELAAECYAEVLRRTPDDRQTLKDLGRVYRMLQDAEREVALYDWWLEKQVISKDPEILALGGEGLEYLGLQDRARQRYEEALVTNPDPRIRLRLAEILLGTGSLEDARKAAEVFRRAAAEGGDRAAAVSGEARALLAVGDASGARAVLGKITAESEKDAAWYLAMGAVLYCEAPFPPPGNPALLQQALSHFEAALERSAPASEQRGIARTDVAIVKARLAALMAEDDPARRTALEESIALADAALLDDPFNYYWPLVARGYALRALGEPDKAVESLQEAVASWPGEAYGRTLLGEFLLRDGRFEEARTQFLAATRIATGFPDALGGVGRAGGGEAGEARDYLRRAMELEPKTGIWPLLSARALLADEGLPLKQRLEEARRDLSWLVEKVDRTQPLPIAALGWVRYMQGDPADALNQWNLAQRLLNGIKPSSPRESIHLAALNDWLNGSRVKVSKWMNTRIWRDDFDRPDGSALGNGWQEEEKNVKITIKDGAAVVGPGIVAAGDEPRIWREWDAAKVLKGSVEFTVLREEPEQVDVFFWVPQGKNPATILGIRKDEAGKASLLVKLDHRTKENEIPREIPGFTWPEDGHVVFEFVKMDENKGTVALLVNGRVIPGYEALEVQTLMKTRGGKLRVEVKCTANMGTEVRAKVEAVVTWLDIQ